MSNHARPALDPEAVRAHLDKLSREPFRDVLARFLEGAPSGEEITKWAQSRPDRWAQALAIAARLSGYTDKLEVEGSIEHNVHQWSDAALQARIEQLRQQALEGSQSEQNDANNSVPAIDFKGNQ